MFNLTRVSVLVVVCSMTTTVFSQSRTTITGARASAIVSSAQQVITDRENNPTFIRFQENTPVRELAYLKEGMGLDDACDMQISASHKDELGFQHVKYQETYEGLRIVGAEYIFHVKGSSVINGNGRVYREVNVNTNPALTEEQALNQALLEIDANAYMWESKEEETLLRQTTNDPTATYYPSGELAISSANYDPSEALQLAYIFDIYATDPLGRFEVEVDAHTGEILNKYDKIHHTAAVGSGTTLYDGDVPLQVTQHGGHYHLTETTRGNGIHTYDMNNGTNYSEATIFQEGDSYFDEPTSIAGVSAHFGAGATYDYFYNNHGRNSFDDRGAAIRSYVHYSTNYVNAFWDGSRMTYGDGNGTSITPLVSLDIVGHEIVHALTQYSAGLIYMNESGALNESFSDIFGQSIEFETFPATASWNLGDQIFTNGRSMIRSLSDPKSQGQPDTYFGERWFTGSDNNGGVHTNSGVQNYWYYLLVEGGSGTNDYGYNYGVPSIGRAAADAIAYRNLTVYLTASSNYIDARAGAEQSAIDLFGENSPQHLAVIEAWNAVGVPSVEPVLTVASALDFGNAIVNNTATLDLAIRNDGYSDLSITRIEVNNAVFVPATSTLTIASLATEKLEIAFSPTANQPYSGQMTIYSNADTVTVSLSGTGVQMPSFTLSQDYFDLTHAAGELASYPITITNNNSFGLNFSFDTDAPQNATPTFIPTSTKLKVGKGELEAFRAVPSLKGEDVGSGYRWQDSGEGVAFDWLDIEGIGTTVTLGDDDNSDYIDLGFDFDFFEQAHNSISIGSNGWLSFTVNSFGLWSLPLPAPQAPANVIAWMAHDLYPGGPCIYYQDAANERFIVQYTNWTDWTTRTGSYTVQVQIYKSGKILMLYQTVVNPVGGVIGIQNQFKAQGLTVAYNDPSFFRNNYAVEISRIPRWLQASQEEIFVPANTSRAFTAEINTTRLIAGDYSAKLLLGLPDYNTLVDEVQFDLTVDGRANLLVPGNLSFGNGNVGQEKLETLEIVNNGSEDILISSIAFDNGTNFSTTAGSFTVRAQQEANIDVRFVAPGLGEYTDVLRINTNDPDVPQKAVTLVGRGTLAPVLSTDPTSLSVTLAQGASTTRTIVVSNIDNADDLTFSVGYRNVETVLGKSQTFVGSAPVADDKVAEPAVSEPPIYKSTVAAEVSNTIGNNTALSEVKAKLDESYNSITTLIPNRFDFAEGETGTNIGDGGDDLYDGGNFLSTNLAGPIAYSNGRILTHSAFGGSSYFTEKYTGLFVLSADLGGATGFTIDGNLGADGGGSVDGAVLEISRFGKTFLGFVKRVFESGDPSVNHLIIVESNGTATHEFSTNTNDDLHEVSNLSGVDRMYYLLFSAGNNGEYINDATMLNIINIFGYRR
ncbi:MAG: M4 family metallopeptidase [Bacteroidota bacterium]